MDDAIFGLEGAIAWCDQAHGALNICRRWVARLGGKFHPDTKGSG
jgi:hypothetical protein